MTSMFRSARVAPQLKDQATISSIMLDVIVALLPALGMAVYFFGARVLVLSLISVASCVLLFFLPYWGWTPLWLLWMAGSWLSCRQAGRRWLRLLHGGLALFFGAMALVNTGIAFYYA